MKAEVENIGLKRNGRSMSFIFCEIRHFPANELRAVKSFSFYVMGRGFTRRFVRWTTALSLDSRFGRPSMDCVAIVPAAEPAKLRDQVFGLFIFALVGQVVAYRPAQFVSRALRALLVSPHRELFSAET